ncbi:MAG: elongation factor Ts [Chloroflexi bacterium RBG_16_50_11]|nr:MAG: elongation factor Ts [Chloroflexi bacterium RBG_16_50_11]
MEITTKKIKTLREQSGAGVMDCRGALVGCGGDIDKALQMLKEKGLLKAQKKAERTTRQGLVEAYIHTAGRIGAMVEVNCETDFVARTEEFKGLAHCLAMQVAAMNPQYISEKNIPEGKEVIPAEACLMLQPYIKDPTKIIKDIIAETIAKTGENIKVSRFTRYELGG